MCLVAFAWKTHPRWRLALLGNRDEHHERPSAALNAWPDRRVLAGRDLRSGGTWMGLGPDGRVAVVTNVRDGLSPAREGRSRGALPADFLDGPQSAAGYVGTLADDALAYPPFNLVVADADACHYLGNHPHPRQQAVPAGVHGMSNGGFDADWPKTRRLRDALDHWCTAGIDSLDPLWDALADDSVAEDAALPDTGVGLELERLLSSAFIRGSQYGTRASTIVLVDHAGQGQIHERRFGPEGVFEGRTSLHQAA